jgi:hypothetical protein
VYPGQGIIRNPSALSSLWPKALADRIANGSASVIHMPFNQKAIEDAVGQFSHNKLPLNGGLGFYNDDAYRSFGFTV